jgi:hypothetical protein
MTDTDDRRKSQEHTNKRLKEFLFSVANEPIDGTKTAPARQISTRDRALQIMELSEGIHALTERGDSDLAIRLLSERIQETAFEIVKEQGEQV